MTSTPILSLTDFQDRNSTYVFKVGSKQVLLIGVEGKVFAIDNRCPHEGYPLSKGKSNSQCVLTCNWHNWKFDLHTGQCLVGGDNVRVYPVRIEEGTIYVDTSGPSIEELQKEILGGLMTAVEKRQYGRIARELSRLVFNSIDPLIAIEEIILWSHNRFEYGTTHAFAACADWLALYSTLDGSGESDLEKKIICLTEAIDHIAHDALRRPIYPFVDDRLPYDPSAFRAAIESEDHHVAYALLNDALAVGMGMTELEEDFVQIALEHYNDFGHSLIYVQKSAAISAIFKNPIIDGCLLKSLTRSLLYATREDLLPEFIQYPKTLQVLYNQGFGIETKIIDTPLQGQRINKAMHWTVENAKHYAPTAIFRSLLMANAQHLSQYDMSFQDAFTGPVTQNVGWLDFTHALTFANAVHHFASKYPKYWASGLLQLACFYGRNSPYIDPKLSIGTEPIINLDEWKSKIIDGIFDHGIAEPIHSAHVLKTSISIFEEARKLSNADKQLLYQALKRLLNSPLKRKHARRIACQAIALVGKDF